MSTGTPAQLDNAIYTCLLCLLNVDQMPCSKKLLLSSNFRVIYLVHHAHEHLCLAPSSGEPRQTLDLTTSLLHGRHVSIGTRHIAPCLPASFCPTNRVQSLFRVWASKTSPCFLDTEFEPVAVQCCLRSVCWLEERCYENSLTREKRHVHKIPFPNSPDHNASLPRPGRSTSSSTWHRGGLFLALEIDAPRLPLRLEGCCNGDCTTQASSSHQTDDCLEGLWVSRREIWSFQSYLYIRALPRSEVRETYIVCIGPGECITGALLFQILFIDKRAKPVGPLSAFGERWLRESLGAVVEDALTKQELYANSWIALLHQKPLRAQMCDSRERMKLSY